VTVSLGVVVAEDRDEPMDLLWRRADRALYAAKAGGRDRAAVATAKASAPIPLPA
jgi:GGDEF domain-containing protein